MGEEWSLAAFSGWMLLGNTHAMLGRMDDSIACYDKGLQGTTRSSERSVW
jgi:cytochrome c-type biogenesis protein CcmH/NrfG